MTRGSGMYVTGAKVSVAGDELGSSGGADAVELSMGS